MENFKKLIVGCLLLSVCLASCKKDDDLAFIGSWQNISTEEGSVSVRTMTITFKADNTGIVEELYQVPNKPTADESYSYSFSWSVSGSQLTISGIDETFTMGWAVNGNQITFNYPDGTSEVYTRK